MKGKPTSVSATATTPVLFARHIHFTDAPDGLWRFYLTDNVLLLPSEY